jgi:2-polyprenyl-3-methyl-5-hydroxy-6-metoxy-1,4-benzoquinol methylase
MLSEKFLLKKKFKMDKNFPNPLFELQKTLYQSTNYTRRRLHQRRLAWVASSIEKHAVNAPLNKAIEYGPGSGIYLPTLARNFNLVVAADVENAYLSGILPLVDQIAGLSLVVDDILDSKLQKESFGLVLCSEVLEHVKSPEDAIGTLYNILVPGGIAVVTTPQRYSLLELCCKVAFLPGVIQLVRKIYREPVLETGHISLRSSVEFRGALIGNGFEVLEEDKFGLYIPLLAEFGGGEGGRFIESLERYFKNTFLNELFWTQAYVLRRPLK